MEQGAPDWVWPVRLSICLFMNDFFFSTVSNFLLWIMVCHDSFIWTTNFLFCIHARSHIFESIHLNHLYADNFISIKFRGSWMANGISPNSDPLAIALLSRVCHPFSLTYAFHYFERGQDISLSQRPEKEQWCCQWEDNMQQGRHVSQGDVSNPPVEEQLQAEVWS